MHLHSFRLRQSAAFFAIFTFICFSSHAARAQTITITPANVSFGAPAHGASIETTNIAVTGSGSVALSGFAISGANAGDFVQTNTCASQLTAPASCAITLTFTPTATGLETATLSFNSTNVVSGSQPVPHSVVLTGAAGAIKLFEPINIATSNPLAGSSEPFAFKSTTLNLNCSSGATARLSSTPDGTGNVLVDNFLTVAVNGSPVGTGSPAGNVCAGGQTEGGVQADCFTASGYQQPTEAGELTGADPDTVTAAGGVPPIDISSSLSGLTSNVPVSISLLDGGGFQASSSLFLVTSCTQAGVQPGGTITSNNLDPSNPATLTPQFTFDNTPNQNIQFNAQYLNAGTYPVGDNTTAAVTDIGIEQADFPALVAGTSAGPAVCLRLSGELDANGNPMCKGFLIQCNSSSNPTLAGDSCPQAGVRSLLFAARFASPDAPENVNFLRNFAPGTGPGFLMGSDNWTSSSTVGSAADCVLEGPEQGNLCPQNILTSFNGADAKHGGTTTSTNSLFIPVLNMPLPSTVPTIAGTSAASASIVWVNSTAAIASFAASPATYTAPSTNLPANGFTPAPIYSVTYGTSPASSPVPDPTLPIPGDSTSYNIGTNQGTFGAGHPLCSVGPGATTPVTPAGTFNTGNVNLNLTAEGQYYLHYFATDCADTEELNFTYPANPNDPNLNWASFKTVLVGVDNTAPAVNSVALSATSVVPGQTITASYSCSDALSNNVASGLAACGSTTFTLGEDTSASTSTSPLTGPLNSGPLRATLTATGLGSHVYSVTAKDFAGNTATSTANYSVVPYTFSGFSFPLRNPPAINVAGSGWIVPLIWRVTNPNRSGITGLKLGTSGGTVGLSAAQGTMCKTSRGTVNPNVGAFDNSGLVSLGSGYYLFIWQVSEPKGACVVLNLNPGDGSSHQAYFQIQ